MIFEPISSTKSLFKQINPCCFTGFVSLLLKSIIVLFSLLVSMVRILAADPSVASHEVANNQYKKPEYITVILIDNNNPFSFTLPTGKHVGMYVDFWQLWSKYSNIPVKFVMKEFEASVLAVNDKNVIHSGLFKTDKRLASSEFTLPIHSVNTGIIYNDNYTSETLLSELTSETIAAPTGSFQSFFLKENYPTLKFYGFTDTNLTINKLLNNDIQAIVGEQPFLRAQVAKVGLGSVLVFSDEVLVSNTIHGMISLGQPGFLNFLNKSIKNIPIDELVAMEIKWLPDLNPFHQGEGALATLTIEERDWLKTHSNYKLGLDSSWAPYEFKDENDDYQGITVDYFNFLRKALNIRINPVSNLSWTEAFTELKKGNIDIMSGMVSTPERAKVLNFTEPYIVIPTVVVRRKGTFYADSLNSLSGKRLGIVDGYAFVELIGRDYPQINIIPVKSVADGLLQLQENNIDAFIDVHSGINFEMDRRQILDLEIDSFTPYKLELSVAIRKGLEPLVPILNKTFAQMSLKDKGIIDNTWLRTQITTGTDLVTILKWTIPILTILFLIIVSIIRINRRMESEITDRKKAEQFLKAAKDAAIVANKAKSDFLANISHEIRTPMNAVIGMSHLLEEEGLNDKQLKYIDILNSSSSTLLMLINDILDLSKIEAGKLDLEEAPFILSDLVSNTCSQVKLNIDDNHVTFITNISDEIPKILSGDTLRLGQILLNILSNACKFTEQGSIILDVSFIERTRETISLLFKISDTGIGMNDEQQSRLFQTYSQADSSTTRRFGGTGLGLSISKSLAELMSGRIDVESVLGKGSQFSIYVTVKLLIEDERERLKSEVGLTANNELVTTEENSSIYSEFSQLSGKNVLVVDDNKVNLIVASKILRKAGIRVTKAMNGQEAVDLANSEDFDAILMDIQMPILDGYAATIELKKLSKHENLPIIALSANVMKDDIEQSFEVGMSAHLAKPLDIRKLFEVLAELIVE